MESLKKELETYSELYWWNMGKKTLDFKGTLKELLKRHGIKYSRRRTECKGLYKYYFKSISGISYIQTGTIHDFKYLAKKFIQMELVRMGDKSMLYVQNCWRSTVTINF